MNFSIPCVYYPQYPQYCLVNQPIMVYAYPQMVDQSCFDLKVPDQCPTSDDSKSAEVPCEPITAKLEEVPTSEPSKPVLSLTESDLERYICNINRKLWNEEEDELLKKLASEHDLDWKTIAASFPERNPNQCYGRYRRIIRDSKRRGWSKREDEILIECVSKYGQCWKAFTKYLESTFKIYSDRTSKQIRERYLNSLRPNIVNEEWSVQEDMKICELINIHGKKWKMFEEHLPGRTENRIKNRYYGHIKKIQALKTKQNKYKEMKKSKKSSSELQL